MGYLSQIMNQYDDSIELLEIGLQLAPMHAEMASYLAMGYLRQRRYDEALEKMTHALKCGPNNPNVLLNAIQSEDYLSFNEKQKALLLKVIETQQNSPQTKNAILLRQAKELIKQNQHAEALKVLGEMDDSINGLGPEKYFNIAQIQRSEGDPEKAFSTYKKANDMLAQSKNARKYNKYALIEKMQHQIDLLDEKFAESIKARIFHNDVKETYPNPVFLSGFPRSGTTLTGTILDQHPKLITTDEYGAMDQARIHFTQKFQKRLPDCLTDINAEEVKFLRDMYDVKQASIPSQNPDKILVDKIPLNTSNGIMIYAVFPNSKILYIHRHPLDAILSGYMQYFAMNSAMVLFNNIEDMAKLYVKMNEQWKSQKKYLPIDYHEFKYEDLVENFDEEVGKILDFIGVEWDDNVRNFNKEDASAAGPKTLTPSRTQVSQSLYKGARNRWKKYEKHLKPAIDILGDTIEELGYEL